MKKNPKVKFLMVVGLFPAAAALAAGETNRLYLTTDIGPAFQQNLAISSGSTIDFDTGIRGDLGIGYRVKPWLAGEVTAGVVWNSVNSIGGVPMSSYGGSMDLYQIPLMANMVLIAPAWHGLQPYVGGGLGTVFGRLEFNSPLGNIHNTDTTFAYQALAGVNYQISSRWSLGLGYKYLCTQDHGWTQNGVTLDTEGTATHAVTVSLTWSF